MNETIKMIIDEANKDLDGIDVRSMPMFDSSYDKFLEQYTKLIIDKCIDEMTTSAERLPGPINNIIYFTGCNIRNMFGFVV